jgi:hemoglobin-like flavoprotein
MLTDDEKLIIKDTWRLVIPIGETAADLFYKRLFELQPTYKAYFKNDMA